MCGEFSRKFGNRTRRSVRAYKRVCEKPKRFFQWIDDPTLGSQSAQWIEKREPNIEFDRGLISSRENINFGPTPAVYIVLWIDVNMMRSWNNQSQFDSTWPNGLPPNDYACLTTHKRRIVIEWIQQNFMHELAEDYFKRIKIIKRKKLHNSTICGLSYRWVIIWYKPSWTLKFSS